MSDKKFRPILDRGFHLEKTNKEIKSLLIAQFGRSIAPTVATIEGFRLGYKRRQSGRKPVSEAVLEIIRVRSFLFFSL